jgi:phage terminase large subunit-like protein
MEFFRAGATYRERCFMAANRVGKTWGAGGYEVALHLLGEYPDWWEGRRFECPVDAWAAGKTNESTRDIVQTALLGPANAIGTGLIPGDRILKSTPKTGVPGLLDTVYVQSRYGVSALGVKSYQQGRDAFEGTSRHVIWLDEEPPLDVYGECLIRTATTDGMVLLTFTPLEGLSQVVLSFLPQGWAPGSA